MQEYTTILQHMKSSGLDMKMVKDRLMKLPPEKRPEFFSRYKAQAGLDQAEVQQTEPDKLENMRNVQSAFNYDGSSPRRFVTDEQEAAEAPSIAGTLGEIGQDLKMSAASAVKAATFGLNTKFYSEEDRARLEEWENDPANKAKAGFSTLLGIAMQASGIGLIGGLTRVGIGATTKAGRLAAKAATAQGGVVKGAQALSQAGGEAALGFGRTAATAVETFGVSAAGAALEDRPTSTSEDVLNTIFTGVTAVTPALRAILRTSQATLNGAVSSAGIFTDDTIEAVNRMYELKGADAQTIPTVQENAQKLFDIIETQRSALKASLQGTAKNLTTDVKKGVELLDNQLDVIQRRMKSTVERVENAAAVRDAAEVEKLKALTAASYTEVGEHLLNMRKVAGDYYNYNLAAWLDNPQFKLRGMKMNTSPFIDETLEILSDKGVLKPVMKNKNIMYVVDPQAVPDGGELQKLQSHIENLQNNKGKLTIDEAIELRRTIGKTAAIIKKGGGDLADKRILESKERFDNALRAQLKDYYKGNSELADKAMGAYESINKEFHELRNLSDDIMSKAGTAKKDQFTKLEKYVNTLAEDILDNPQDPRLRGAMRRIIYASDDKNTQKVVRSYFVNVMKTIKKTKTHADVLKTPEKAQKVISNVHRQIDQIIKSGKVTDEHLKSFGKQYDLINDLTDMQDVLNARPDVPDIMKKAFSSLENLEDLKSQLPRQHHAQIDELINARKVLDNFAQRLPRNQKGLASVLKNKGQLPLDQENALIHLSNQYPEVAKILEDNRLGQLLEETRLLMGPGVTVATALNAFFRSPSMLSKAIVSADARLAKAASKIVVSTKARAIANQYNAFRRLAAAYEAKRGNSERARAVENTDEGVEMSREDMLK